MDTSSSPRILFSSDDYLLASPIRDVLRKGGFHVDLASSYQQLEQVWPSLRPEIVLFEVSRPDSIEPATASALRIKRLDASQFIGYLADANLRTFGLTGDAILSRDVTLLPETLRQIYTGKL